MTVETSPSPSLSVASLNNLFYQHPTKSFILSTSPALLDLEHINDTLDSDFLHWGERLPQETLKEMTENSWCWAIYSIKDGAQANTNTTDTLDRSQLEQVGLARLITDYTSFAYVTDVYVLPSYQGNGLSSWLLKELNTVLESWPYFRRLMLICDSTQGKRFYEKYLGMKEFDLGEKYSMMNKGFQGSKLESSNH